MHFNLAWDHNAGRLADERSDRFTGIVAYDRRLGPDTMLVTEFVREQEREKHKTANIVELVIRRQVTPHTVLGIGVGVGIGPDSPAVRVTGALQHSF